MTLESPQWQHTKPTNGAVILLFNTEQMLNFSAFCFIFTWSEPRSWMTSNTGSTQSNWVLKLNSFFRSLTEADYEIISILALQCFGRRILLFHSVDGRSFLQQLLMGDFFWNGLKGTIQKSTLFHLLLKTEESQETESPLTEKSGVCSQPFPAVFPWKCSFSFTVSASGCNYSFPPHLCSSSTTCTKHQAQNQWFGHGGGCGVTLQTVTRIMSNRRQSHRVSTAHLKCSKHPEQSLSATEMSFPCRRSGAAAEIGSANILGWISQLLQLSITCKEFCCISFC